jgi:hypothetical protein
MLLEALLSNTQEVAPSVFLVIRAGSSAGLADYLSGGRVPSSVRVAGQRALEATRSERVLRQEDGPRVERGAGVPSEGPSY